MREKWKKLIGFHLNFVRVANVAESLKIDGRCVDFVSQVSVRCARTWRSHFVSHFRFSELYHQLFASVSNDIWVSRTLCCTLASANDQRTGNNANLCHSWRPLANSHRCTQQMMAMRFSSIWILNGERKQISVRKRDTNASDSVNKRAKCRAHSMEHLKHL